MVARCLLVLALGAASAAAAEPTGVRLVYRQRAGADRCPSAAALRRAVAERLGHDPFAVDGARALEVEVAAGSGAPAGGLRARIELVERGKVTGARTLVSRHADCRALGAAVELAIAIAVDPWFVIPADPLVAGAESDAAAPPPAESGDIIPSPPKSAPEAAPETAPSAVREPLQLRAALDLAAALEISASARVAPSFIGQVALGMPGWSLGLEARGDLPSATGSGPTEVSSWLVSGALVPCARPGLVVACALLVAGAEGARASASGASDVALYFAVGARGGVELPLHRWLRLDLHIDALWALSRLTLADGGVTRFETAPASLVFAAGFAGVFR